jgi:endonuclease/exonuclease/phosphatase (EEP) superfamily protein YafD
MLAFALQFVVWGFAGLLAAGTLIPLSPSRVWWVRIWDFPRLHVAGGFALLLPLSLLLSGWGAFVLGALGLLGLAYQMSWILPYTPFARREVRFAPDGPGAVTLLAVNVLMENDRFDLMRALIEKVDPDVLLLMETDARWTKEMEPALAGYETVLREPRDDHYGMIFATRLKAKEAKIVHLTHDTTPTALAELTTETGRDFTFVGLHPQPPVPDGDDAHERDAQIIYAARFARRTDTPLVAMGDFNEAAWSKSATQFKRVGGYVDPRVGRGMYASFNAKHFMIRCPIDQIYVTRRWPSSPSTSAPRWGPTTSPSPRACASSPSWAAAQHPAAAARPDRDHAPRRDRRRLPQPPGRRLGRGARRAGGGDAD